MSPLYAQLKRLIEQKEKCTLATVVDAGDNLRTLRGQKLLVTDAGVFGALRDTRLGKKINQLIETTVPQEETHLYELEDETGVATVFAEHYYPVARLLVLGGGHIARPLVTIASLLHYEIVVVDDRPYFANRARFPEAREVICSDFSQALQAQKIDSGMSVVIITRGHKHDLDCLNNVLRYDPGYVGMIGSRRRVKLTKEHLVASGFSEEKIARVNMPIGLAIGAQTPEEIAVSITAQLVATRRGCAGLPMPPTSTKEQWGLLGRMVEYIDEGQPVVAATVIRTLGSTPRKAGAKMLIQQDGTCLGTIGGGCGEAEVRSEAMMVFDSGDARLIRVVMDADVAAEEGMACGGVIDVFLERLA